LEKGLVREILTTNFDLLIEKALEQIGWSLGVDFNVYSTEDDFSRIDTHLGLPAIFKIHGSASDVDGMRVTLSQVASRMPSQGRAKVLEHFLVLVSHCPGKHEVGGLPEPFGSFRGFRLICDTNEVTECMRRTFLNG
jgi:hypothetical protein